MGPSAPPLLDCSFIYSRLKCRWELSTAATLFSQRGSCEGKLTLHCSTEKKKMMTMTKRRRKKREPNRGNRRTRRTQFSNGNSKWDGGGTNLSITLKKKKEKKTKTKRTAALVHGTGWRCLQLRLCRSPSASFPFSCGEPRSLCATPTPVHHSPHPPFSSSLFITLHTLTHTTNGWTTRREEERQPTFLPR